MAAPERYYRLHIRNQADTADLLVLSSFPGDTHCLLSAEPNGDGTGIDPIEGKGTVARYVWRASDRYESATERVITKNIADAAARNQMLSNRAISRTSSDGVVWSDLHTGYVNNSRLISAQEFEFTIGDTDRREQDREIWRYVDRAAGLFPKVSCIIGGPIPGGFGLGLGLKLDYGPVRFKVIADPGGILINNRVTLELVSGYLRPYYDVLRTSFQEDEKNTINRLAKQWFEYDADTFATDGSQLSQPWGWFPGLIVELDPVAAGSIIYTNPIAKETTKLSTVGGYSGPEGPSGEHDALVNGSSPRLILRWDDTVFGVGLTPPQPAVNTEFDVLVYAKEISATSPQQVTGHPCDIWALLQQQEGIPYDAASVTSTKAALGDLYVEYTITAGQKLGAWVAEKLFGPWGFAAQIKANGEREIFPTRTASPASVATVGVNDLATDDGEAPKEVIFEVDESTVINGVDYRFQTIKRWKGPTYVEYRAGGRTFRFKVAGEDIEQQTINLLTYGNFTVEGRRIATAIYGARVLEFDIPGQLLFLNTALNAYTAARLTEYVYAAGDAIIDRTGWGIIEGEIRVKHSIAGRPGDYIDLTAPHQVNAKVAQTPKAQRGGTRKVQIVKRTEDGSSSVLRLWDAGNVVQAPPIIDDTTTEQPGGITVPTFTLAPQSVAPLGGVADPLHVATITVTNAATIAALNAEVHFEYLVQSAMPSASTSGLPLGSLPQPDVDNTLDTPAIDPSGQTVWVRAQSRVRATGQVSAWSAWTSITLGPETTGSEVPRPELSFTIDGSGLVDIAASVASGVTSVKFAAASVGAAEATDAAVRAATADTVAPFEALDLFTLAAGEQRAVSAFAYDAFGNESAKATIVVTRGSVSAARKYGAAYIIDGGGAVITVGEKAGYVRVPATGFIRGWSLFGKAGTNGNLTIDSWKDTYANHPPTVADSIWATKPTLTAQDKNEATGLSIAVTEGDILRHKVDACTLHDEGTLNYHFEASA